MTRASGPVIRQDLPRLTSTATAVAWRCTWRTRARSGHTAPTHSPSRARVIPTYGSRRRRLLLPSARLQRVDDRGRILQTARRALRQPLHELVAVDDVDVVDSRDAI